MMWLLSLLLFVDPSPCVEWGRRVAMGGDEEVVKQTAAWEGELPACGSFLRARALMRLAKPEGQASALELFTALAKQPAPLGDWAKRYALELSYTLKKPATVELPPAAFVGAEVAAMYDAANIASGQVTAGTISPQALALLTNPRDNRNLQWMSAVIASDLGKRLPPSSAQPAWSVDARRALFVEFPDDDAAPLVFPEATLADLVRRAEVTSEKHMNADVLKTVEAALLQTKEPVQKDDRCRLTFFKGAALRKQRKYALSEEALTEAAKLCDGLVGDFYKRASFLLAQVQVISRPLEVAEKTLNKFAEQFTGDSLVDDALFLLAVSMEKAQRASDAEAMYDRIGKIDGDKCGEARFRAAYLRFKDARFKQALPLFVDIGGGKRCTDEYEKVRGLYWESRTRDKLKQKTAEVHKPLQTILQIAPLSYYGLMSVARTKKPYEFKTPHAPNVRPMGALLSTNEAQRSLTLSQLGLYLEAKEELAPLESRLSNDGERAAFSDLLSEAFEPYRSHLLARTALKERLGPVPDANNLALWNLAYPRPFNEVTSAEQKEDLPTDLLLALIREESAFMMQVGSWANAYGLTQLLVETAEMTAKDMKLGRAVTAQDLRSDAALSIRLGAHHVAMLRRKFTSAPLWLAAYNAGAGNVNKWVKARGDKPLDEFIEEIPLDETRGYVKRILRSWAVYRVLSGRPVAEISLSLR